MEQDKRATAKRKAEHESPSGQTKRRKVGEEADNADGSQHLIIPLMACSLETFSQTPQGTAFRQPLMIQMMMIQRPWHL